jgi:SAM-dependent methyltransferase
MKKQLINKYADIDWADLRAQALVDKGWKEKGSADWDRKADSFSRRNKSTGYVDRFLAHLPLSPSLTVLDIGSGPGTLALPVAARVRAVTAVDFSRGMLDILEAQARASQLENITTVHCSWEDDWAALGIEPHDIAIASRSLGVGDLGAALDKLDRYATRAVFITDRIGTTPFEAGAFAAIGRPFSPGPDYIYTINILYTLGIHPNLVILELAQEAEYASMEEALNSYSWMFQAITPGESAALRDYLASRVIAAAGERLTIRRETPPRWALIWWAKTAATTSPLPLNDPAQV